MKTGKSCGTGIHQYEIHINVANKIFRISSADHKNCQQLEYFYFESFEDTKNYYFAICLGNKDESVTVYKIEEVKEFEDFMKWRAPQEIRRKEEIIKINV